MARLITPMRARPSCARPSAITSRNFFAAAGQCSASLRQRARISLFAPDLGDEGAPFVEHFAGRHGHCVEGERLRRLRRLQSPAADRRCGLWLRRRRLRCIGQRRETAGNGRDFIRPRVRLRRANARSSKTMANKASSTAMPRTIRLNILTPLTARTLRQADARPALDCRGPDYRHLACIALRRQTRHRNCREQRAKSLTPLTDNFNVR